MLSVLGSYVPRSDAQSHAADFGVVELCFERQRESVTKFDAATCAELGIRDIRTRRSLRAEDQRQRRALRAHWSQGVGLCETP